MQLVSSALSRPRAAPQPGLSPLPRQEPLSVPRAPRVPLTRSSALAVGSCDKKALRQPSRLRRHQNPSLWPCTSSCPGVRSMTSLSVRAARALSPKSEGALTSLGQSVGVVVVDHGSRRAESNANLDEFVGVFQKETGYSIVEAAHMELARPTIAEAFAKCVERGADFIIVSPYFLAPGRHWSQDIPSICAEAAAPHPGLRYMVAAPIGAHPLVAQILQDRISQCLKRGGDCLGIFRRTRNVQGHCRHGSGTK